MNMHKMVIRQLLIVLSIASFAFTLTGCGGIAKKNNLAMNELRLGQSEDTVVSIMGQPQKTSAFKNKTYWLYRTSYSSNDYDRFTPILFANGKVEGWGKQYLQEIGITPEIDSYYGGGSSLILPSMSSAPTYNQPSTVIPRQPAFLPNQPQLPIQNPSTNCNPNGSGGFRCQ